jgi:hypothetical protein
MSIVRSIELIAQSPNGFDDACNHHRLILGQGRLSGEEVGGVNDIIGASARFAA